MRSGSSGLKYQAILFWQEIQNSARGLHALKSQADGEGNEGGDSGAVDGLPRVTAVSVQAKIMSM